MVYDTIKRLLPETSFKEYKADLTLEIITPANRVHSTMVFKSADKESSLRGFGVDFVVIDEASRVREESFVSVMTTLTQTMGRAIIVSTPKGRGWFYDVYQRGQKMDERGRPRFGPLNPDPFESWYAIRLPTWANPHVPRQAIIDAKRNLPEDVFRQEFAAQFIDDSAGVFRGVTECISGDLFTKPQPGHNYVMGVDLARLRDYSVIVVMDSNTRRVVYMERFNTVAWETQYHKITQVAKFYNALVCMDSSGIGDPIVETLTNAGLRILPYKITGTQAKQQLIEKLRVNIENRSISYPENKYTLPMLDELRCFESTFTDSGRVQYSAPRGKHDDCVISLSLANWIIDRRPTTYRTYFVDGI